MATNSSVGQRLAEADGDARSAHQRRLTGGPLGIVTKTTSPESWRTSQRYLVDHETGEITPYEFRGPDRDMVVVNTPEQSRVNRWAIKSVSNRLLPTSRTAKCMVLRAPIPGYGLADIDVCKGHTHGKAFYHGLMACGSVWTCPICAAKVSERRRGELKDAIEAAKALGWVPHFVTLTVPHGAGDDVKELLGKLSEALKRLSNGKYAIKRRIEQEHPSEPLHGYIRALEVTHGQNGFHPHFHMILFTSPGITSPFLQDAYKTAWQRACRLAGLPIPSDTHGVTVQDGRFAAEYASKWGIEDEMTKGHTKQTRRKGLTPWGMLRAVLDGDDLDYPAERAGALFQVYAAAFAGRRQLYWSNGLRAKLALANELSDEELVAKPDDEEATILATLSVEQWKAIRRKGQQAHILTVAESAPGLLQQVVNSYTNSKEDVMIEKPGEKGCAKCRSVVQPEWRAVLLAGQEGWIGKSTCPKCGHLSMHIAGDGGFSMLANSVHQTGGDLTKLPSL